MTGAAAPSDPSCVTLVVGGGGLLGTALTAALRSAGDGIVLTSHVSWTTRQALADLGEAVDRLAAAALTFRVPWRVAWCAGAGVTGTSDQMLDQEVATLAGFLARLAGTAGLGPGTVFLASSAGGLYSGGGKGEPYDEHDVPVPISAYGRAKLAAEGVAGDFARRTGHRVLIGRIANLYGPGQNLSKNQGLISHLCRADLTRQPLSVYVSLDTIRDYLFVDDCAALVADMLDRADALTRAGATGEPTTLKVLASGHGTTIGALVAVCRQVFKRPPRLVLGTSTNARFQVKDLRLRSVIWTDLDRRGLTPLPAGIAATAAGIKRLVQLGTGS